MGCLNIYQALLQIGLVPFYLKILGLDGYGIIGFYMVLFGIAAVLDTAISGAVCREIAWLKEKENQNIKISSLIYSTEIFLWALIICLTLLFLIISFFFNEQWFEQTERYAKHFREISWFAAGAFFTSFPAGFYTGVINGYQKQVRSGLIGAFAYSAKSFGGLAVLGISAADLRLFFIWNMIVGIAHTIILRKVAFEFLPHLNNSAKISWQALKSIKGFAGGMFAITACSSLSVYADRLLLSRFITLSEYGLYVLISTILGGMSRFVSPLLIYYNPLMTGYASAKNKTKLLSSLQEFFGWICALLIPPLIFFAVFSEFWLAWWTKNPNIALGTEKISFLLGVVLLFNFACYPVTSMLYAKAKIAGILKGTISVAILTPLSLFYTIPIFGSKGAASTMAFIALGHFLYIIWIGSKAIKINLSLLVKKLFLCFSLICFSTILLKYGVQNTFIKVSVFLPLIIFIWICHFAFVYNLFKNSQEVQ